MSTALAGSNVTGTGTGGASRIPGGLGQDGGMGRRLAVLLVPMVLAPVVTPRPAGAGGPTVVISGKGWGHGVGMAQDGAYAMGAAGASTGEILAAFYPGTSLARRGGTVRVDLLDGAQREVVVGFPGGGQVGDAQSGAQSPGFPVKVARGGSVRLTFEAGRYHAFPGQGAAPATTAQPTPAPPPPAAPPAAPPPTTVPSLLGIPVGPSAPTAPASPPPVSPPAAPPPAPAEPTSTRSLWAVPQGGSTVEVPALGRRFRGVIEAVGSEGGVQLVNQLDVEQYLRGMGEVLEPGWPPASLRAQAIAARTYALQAMAASHKLCTTQQCQVYIGQTVEYAAMDKAVADTRGQVLVHGRALIEAVYSANGGGVSASPEEGFGARSADYPYLRAAPYPTLDPAPWTVRLDLGDLAARVGYRGRPGGVRVSRAGPSGRALEVTVDGDAGPLAVDGLRFAATFQLRSSLFTLQVGEPAPPGGVEASEPATGALGRLRPPDAGPVVAATPAGALGRTPWVALAVLLLAGWATGAVRTAGRWRRPGG